MFVFEIRRNEAGGQFEYDFHLGIVVGPGLEGLVDQSEILAQIHLVPNVTIDDLGFIGLLHRDGVILLHGTLTRRAADEPELSQGEDMRRGFAPRLTLQAHADHIELVVGARLAVFVVV